MWSGTLSHGEIHHSHTPRNALSWRITKWLQPPGANTLALPSYVVPFHLTLHSIWCPFTLHYMWCPFILHYVVPLHSTLYVVPLYSTLYVCGTPSSYIVCGAPFTPHCMWCPYTLYCMWYSFTLHCVWWPFTTASLPDRAKGRRSFRPTSKRWHLLYFESYQ